jgi:hypothetical protein
MVEHYEGTIEPIEYMAATFTDEEYRGFLKGNIIKYISRAGKKGSAHEDYLKAREYLDWLIEDSEPEMPDIPNKAAPADNGGGNSSQVAEGVYKRGSFIDDDKEYSAWLRKRDALGWF